MGSFPCPDEPAVPHGLHISYSDALGLVQGNCQERNRPEKQGHGGTVGAVPVRGSDRICPVRPRRSRFPGRAMSFLGRNRYNCPFYRPYTETPSVATQIIEISTTYSTDNFRTKRSYRNRGTYYKCGFLLTVEKTAFFFIFRHIIRFQHCSSNHLGHPVHSLPLQIRHQRMAVVIGTDFMQFHE